MRVFVAGGTGHSGSYIIPELIAAGHEVTGLARSDAAAAAVPALGAKVRRGDLQDLDGLKEAARTPTASSTSRTGKTCFPPAGSTPWPPRSSRSCSRTARHCGTGKPLVAAGSMARQGAWAGRSPRRTRHLPAAMSTRAPYGFVTSWKPP
jgi:Nucleoside-diphosphate-sugar epimerases